MACGLAFLAIEFDIQCAVANQGKSELAIIDIVLNKIGDVKFQPFIQILDIDRSAITDRNRSESWRRIAGNRPFIEGIVGIQVDRMHSYDARGAILDGRHEHLQCGLGN